MKLHIIGSVLLPICAFATAACDSEHRAPSPTGSSPAAAPTPYPTATPTAPWFTSPSLDDAAQQALDRAAGHPSFAGRWVGPNPGEIWVASVDPSAMGILLDGFRSQGVAVNIVEARYTYAELRAVQARIADDAPAGNLIGATLATVGVDEIGNHVVVGVDGLTYEQRLAILSRYGPMVEVEEEDRAELNVAG